MNYIPGPREHPRKAAISEDDKLVVLGRQHYLCFYCECSLASRRIVYDHLYPRSKGGPHGIQNRVAACVRCDLDKKNRYPTHDELKKFYEQLKLG